MKLSTPGMGQHGHEVEEERKCLNSELWHACAGPLVSLPTLWFTSLRVTVSSSIYELLPISIQVNSIHLTSLKPLKALIHLQPKLRNQLHSCWPALKALDCSLLADPRECTML